MTASNTSVSIYSITGQLISQTQDSSYLKGDNSITISKNNLESGFYIAEVKTKTASRKIKLIIE